MGEPYDINDQEFESVVRLAASKRYEHFLKRVCDTERVYLLAEHEAPVVLSDETGTERSQLPLWPHPRYAEAYRATFGGAVWAEIGLYALVEEVLPDLTKDGIDAAVFPTPGGNAPVVSPERLKEDIVAYHDEWYGGWPKP